MPLSTKRSTLAVAAACLMLLALPSLAAARPGASPELVQRSGRLVVLHADRYDGTSTQQWMLVNGTSHVKVRAPGDVWIDPGSPVRLEGTMRNGMLVLSDSQTAVEHTGPSPVQTDSASPPAASVENTIVIPVSFASGGPTWTIPTQSNAASLMFDQPGGGQTHSADSLNAYYQEQTYGQVSFSGTVVAPVTIPGPASQCGATSPNDGGDALYTWLNDAEQAAGISDAAYQHVIVALPNVSQCGLSGAAGLGEVGGSHVWINGSFTVPVIAHELGHNLGLWHAGGLTCTSSGSAVPMSNSCSIDRTDYALPQYADPFDAMGNAPTLRQMNMEHKLALGVLPAAAVKVVGASGTYQLAPMETLGPAVELLRLPKPGGGNYFVEYRQPTGVFDSQGSGVTGVLIHTESPDVANQVFDSDTALIDMHPNNGFAANQWYDAAMSVGQVFNDSVHGITITDVAQDTTGATLSITTPIDTTPPSRPGRLSAVVSGTTVSLQWTAAADDFGVASYQVARNGAAVGSTPATSFSDSGLSPGTTVNYSVTAVDGAGHAGSPATIAVSLPDTLPPTAPTNVTAKLMRDGEVQLSWGASTDNSGVASYRVLRSGTGIIQANVTAYVDKTPKPGSGATVVYSVVAFDAAGNASPPADAKPLRAALLRKLGASNLKVTRAKGSSLVRVKGSVSDVQAICRIRLGAGAWHPCKAKTSGAFSVSLHGSAKRVALSLRDELGRVKRQTLRVP